MKNLFHVFLRMFTKFFGEHPSKLVISLCVALLAAPTAFAEKYITDVMVIGGDKDRVDFLKDSCRTQGWSVIDKDLNDNAGAETDYVYILYKKSSESGGSNGFITDFIIKTDDYPDSYIFNGRTYYRIPHKGSEHFEIHGGNLNSGTVSSSTNMRLYYTKEEFPDRRFVRDIAFTDAKLKSGYTTLGRNGAVVGSDGSGAMDLNEGAGSSSDYIYMHFATVSSSMDNPEYISDVVVLGGSKDEVNALKERYASRGWIVIDQDLNDNAGAGTDYIYMAYKKSHFSDVNKGFITDFIIKTGDHPDSFTFNGRTYYRAPNFGDGNFAIYGGNLNSGTVSSSTNMWLYFTRESFPDKRVVSDIAFTTGDVKTKDGYTTLGKNGAAVGSDGSGAMDLNEGAGSSSDYIYMHFAIAPKVNITFVTGLENISVPMQTIVSGLTPTKPNDPECTGLKFMGWFADKVFKKVFDFSAPVTSNTTVYAKWEASVTFVTGVENVSVPTQTIVFGNTPTKPSDPVYSGLKFAGWFADKVFTKEFDFSAPVTSNTTAYAKWEASVTFVTGDENVSVPTQTIVFGNSPKKPDDPERTGFKFLGWYADESFSTEFDFSAPVTSNITVYARWWNGKVTDISALTGNHVAENGELLMGKLGGKYKISIANNATVMLYGVTINGVNNSAKAGLTCEGDCKIILKGENTVKGFDPYYPGIYVPEGKTLIIEGDGSLDASSNGFGAGIGGGNRINCGNIVINGGTVTATGGSNAAGIGSGYKASAGSITISGGSVTATGGNSGAGIGSGYVASAGDITISGGTVTATGGNSGAGIGSGYNNATAGSITISGGSVTATGGSNAAGIGSGYNYATAGSITISGGSVTATGGFEAAGIGSGYNNATAGSITISGGTVTATGGESAAGIGSGYRASAGDITITDGVTLVTANKGERSPNSVGLGKDGKSVGKISIGGVFVDGVSTSPFTYPANDLYTYTIAFESNGGKGTMSNQKMFLGFKGPLLDNVFARSNYAFMGWNTKADGSGTAYADGAKVRNLTDEAGGKVTLYAQWGMPYIDGNGKEQIKQSGEYIVLTGTTDVSTLSSGWYVVMGEVTYENSFDFAGKDVHLILADGAKLTVVNNRADAKTEFNNLAVYAQSKGDKMGAFVVNSSNGDAIKVGENFVINGGVVTAAGFVDAKVFLAGGTVKANGYKGSVSVKEGLFYTDGEGNSYTAGENGAINVVDINGENVTSSFSLDMIAGKNMHPYIPAIQFREFTKNGKTGTLADFNANYNEIVPFGIKGEIKVDSVEFKREFTTVENGYATVIFPFDVQANNLEGVETVVAFGGVNKQYQVLMNVVWDKNKPSDFTLKAHTPYMVHMNKPTLNIHGPVTLKPIEKDTYEVENGNWKFIGTYVFKKWSANDKDLNHAYGYTTVSTNNFSAGQFVIIAKNAITRAFRAYLVETQPQAIAARKPFQNNVGAQTVLSSSYSTPEYMEVVIIDKDEEGKEHTTVIGHFNTRKGEIKLNSVGDRVYDLKGRSIRKDAKKAKGAYYGKKAAR
jgi:uncharacterized repeat protein (TIGR02543 family)